MSDDPLRGQLDVIDQFSDQFVPAAGVLLAARHRAHRAAEPLLPERYEDDDAAAAEVAALWARTRHPAWSPFAPGALSAS